MSDKHMQTSPEKIELGDYLLVTNDGKSEPQIERVTVRAIKNDPGEVMAEDKFGRLFPTSWLHIRALPKTAQNN